MDLEPDEIKAIITRMKRANGHLAHVIRMMEEGSDCESVLTQLAAVNKALEAVALGLLDEHLKHCVADAATEGGPVAEEKIREASAAIARLVRS